MLIKHPSFRGAQAPSTHPLKGDLEGAAEVRRFSPEIRATDPEILEFVPEISPVSPS